MSTTIVGFAISMIFLFLMLSAACSAIQEIVANIMRWRAKTLEKGIAGLFLSEEFKEALYKTPLLEGLCSPNALGTLSRKPSYIPSATLAMAILHLAQEKKMDLTGAACALPTGDALARTETLLRSILRDSKTFEEQKGKLEDWYNDSMSRVSGWYKRKSHMTLWIIGVLLCLAFNADSIAIANAFWNDPTLRAATTEAAMEYVKNAPKDGAAPSEVETRDSFTKLNEVRRQLTTIPLGWCRVSSTTDPMGTCWPNLAGAKRVMTPVAVPVGDPRRVVGDVSEWWFWKLLGISLTALAISQGAPFWFDLLQKVANLRLAGNPPSTTEAAKSRK
ncbi:MAG TPA: hypothetical protein VK608_11560 [Edaphobacter sp.]|nr:hypothetical protein [Edaphobacter sp.]